MKTILVLLLLGISTMALCQQPMLDHVITLSTPFGENCNTMYCADSMLTVAVNKEYHPSVIVRFTPGGDTLWTRELENPGYIYEIEERDGSIYASVSGDYTQRIVKWDATGQEAWDRGMTIFVNSGVTPVGLEVLSDGSVVMAGVMRGTFDFDPMSGTYEYSTSQGDGFLWKLDAEGELAWVKIFNGLPQTWEHIWFLEADAEDNLYTGGQFQDTAYFDTLELIPKGASDGIVFKLSASGELIWAKQFGGTYYTTVRKLALTPAAGIYCAGIFSGATDFDPTNTAMTVHSTMEYVPDMFLLHLDESGNSEWVQVFEGKEMETCTSLVTDRSGQPVMIGLYTDTMDLDPGAGVSLAIPSGAQDNSFALKLDAEGTLLWAFPFEASGSVSAQALAYDSRDRLYVSVIFDDTIDCDPGINDHSLVAKGDWDACLVRLDDHMSIPQAVEDLPGIADGMGLYPNPSTGAFSLVFQDAATRRVEVFDLSGRSVMSFETQAATHAVLLDRPAGLYFLRVSGQGENITKKFVIEQ